MKGWQTRDQEHHSVISKISCGAPQLFNRKQGVCDGIFCYIFNLFCSQSVLQSDDISVAVLIFLEFQLYLKQIVIDNCCLYRQLLARLTYKELQVKILGSLHLSLHNTQLCLVQVSLVRDPCQHFESKSWSCSLFPASSAYGWICCYLAQTAMYPCYGSVWILPESYCHPVGSPAFTPSSQQ